MGRLLLGGLAALLAGIGWAQSDSRTVIGLRTPLLAEGAEAMRVERYEEGIRLTLEGLQTESTTPSSRAAALANLCGAYAALGEADTAIMHCTASIDLSSSNWRAYSNRAYAYWLKQMYSEASSDIDTAEALAPQARQVQQIRGLINERRLTPSVTMEDHR